MEFAKVRNVIQSLLDGDRLATNYVLNLLEHKCGLSSTSYRPHMKYLEVSGHGITWLVIVIGMLYCDYSGERTEFWMNLLFLLLLDIVLIAVIKALARRRRPSATSDADPLSKTLKRLHRHSDTFPKVKDNHFNRYHDATVVDPNSDMFLTFSVDKYSFPSGHASRAVAIFLLVRWISLSWQPLVRFLLIQVFGVWCLAVCISRILLGRHHVLDVIAGAILAVIEIEVVKALWMNKEQAKYLAGFLGFVDDEPWVGA